MGIIEITDFGFSYPGRKEKALTEISLDVAAGTFSLLCGKIGSGKTTLLQNLKKEISPAGEKSGHICICGQDLQDMDVRFSAKTVGFVDQNPESQIVMDSVWGELSFGLENLEILPEEIGRRIGEIAVFFGIEHWMNHRVYELSGGQKQLLSLAAVLAMQPEIILLDEPTAQLDPIAEKNFLQMLVRVNAELGKTIVISTHQFDEVLPLADKVICLDQGLLIYNGDSRGYLEKMYKDNDTLFLPASTRLAVQLSEEVRETSSTEKLPRQLPMDVREGRDWLRQFATMHPLSFEKPPREERKAEVALIAKNVWFRYTAEGGFVLTGLETEIRKGEIHGFVGGNGGGKSTLLKLFSGILKPQKGKIHRTQEVRSSMLFQDARAAFFCDTLLEDLMQGAKISETKGEDTQGRVLEMARRFALEKYLSNHPFDLSAGEIQKAAFAKVLLTRPDILLLDEPVKGLDETEKKKIGEVLWMLRDSGVGIALVTHDVEFVAHYADRCSMLFGHAIIATGEGKAFFNRNMFYTTAVSRMTRGLADGCVVEEDVHANKR
ncbi:MAG: ATP-binding cassette domain-containing protein [Clostridiales Family XIII bacterium]|jgi:energy-coupling factor transport system ATP-binding protein|nr:ATP-binding cassette domain-containing protein [Clostridiales Family XIII bacterium]